MKRENRRETLIKVKPNLTKKKTNEVRGITVDGEQLYTMVNFVYAGIHGDIKVRLNNIFRCKYVHNFH